MEPNGVKFIVSPEKRTRFGVTYEFQIALELANWPTILTSVIFRPMGFGLRGSRSTEWIVTAPSRVQSPETEDSPRLL
jgi:hypothetical protein